jgi:hypothetical protein
LLFPAITSDVEEDDAMIKKTMLATLVLGLGLLPEAATAGRKAERQSVAALKCLEHVARCESVHARCLGLCVRRAEMFGETFDIEGCEARCEMIHETKMANLAERQYCREAMDELP